MADIVYFVRDMLFTSKIKETARHRGLSAQPVPDPAALGAAAADARLVIVDLRLDRALEALDALAASAPGVPSVGFVDHERVDLMDAARARGCGQVLTKGQFSKGLPDLFEPPLPPAA
jgi:DNA-binding NarL/FixJ family response regulator